MKKWKQAFELKLGSGWAWGVIGFVLSTVISWMAPFGQLPRRYFENVYQHFETRLATRGHLDAVDATALSFAPLLSYPWNELDFKGWVQLENTLSSVVTITGTTLKINGQPAKVRLWESEGPSTLQPKQKQEFVFFTSSIPIDPNASYSMLMEFSNSLSQVSSVEAKLAFR